MQHGIPGRAVSCRCLEYGARTPPLQASWIPLHPLVDPGSTSASAVSNPRESKHPRELVITSRKQKKLG